MKKQRFFCNYELCSDKRIFLKKGTNFGKKVGSDMCRLFKKGNKGDIAILDGSRGHFHA